MYTTYIPVASLLSYFWPPSPFLLLFSHWRFLSAPCEWNMPIVAHFFFTLTLCSPSLTSKPTTDQRVRGGKKEGHSKEYSLRYINTVIQYIISLWSDWFVLLVLAAVGFSLLVKLFQWHRYIQHFVWSVNKQILTGILDLLIKSPLLIPYKLAVWS